MGDPDGQYDKVAAEILQDLNNVPPDVAICGLVFGSLCTASALFGNVLIVIAFLSDRTLRQRQNTFVISAAINEVLMVFLRDVFILGVYGLGSWRYGERMLYANQAIFVIKNTLAIGHVVAVTVYRYALIVHPKLYRFVSRTPVIVCTLATLYLIAFSSASVVLLRRLVFCTKGMFAITEESLGIYNGTHDASRMQNNSLSSFVYVSLNALILGFCNTHIYFFIKHSSRRIAGASGTTTSSSSNAVGGGKSASGTKKEAKFVKIMAMIFGTFIISYYVIPFFVTFDRGWKLSHWTYLPFVVTYWLSSSANWVIFSLTHQRFREAVKRIPSRSTNVKPIA